MGDWPMLPVVHRANLQQLLGVISLEDVMRAYRGAGMPMMNGDRAEEAQMKER
jgi:hypothetical protein